LFVIAQSNRASAALPANTVALARGVR
jgi:hypothetical protein